MKLLNQTNKDLMIPVRVPKNMSGVYQPINHLIAKKGEWKDIPEESVQGAKMMGMVVKAEESSVGEVKVETKQMADSEEKPEKKKKTEEEIYAMNKKEQSDLLKKLGAEKIPKYESDRVKLILELGNK